MGNTIAANPPVAQTIPAIDNNIQEQQFKYGASTPEESAQIDTIIQEGVAGIIGLQAVSQFMDAEKRRKDPPEGSLAAELKEEKDKLKRGDV